MIGSSPMSCGRQTTLDPCPDCGAPLGGREGCDAAFHEFGARAALDVAFAYRRRAFVDAYCLQHPAYIASLKSFAAHLCGLCAAVERSDDPRAQQTIWSDLRIPPDAVKPAIPSHRGTVTLVDVRGAESGEDFQAAVDAWLANVWEAWREHHDLARRWLDFSISRRRR
jgi:hypothetical protein